MPEGDKEKFTSFSSAALSKRIALHNSLTESEMPNAPNCMKMKTVFFETGETKKYCKSNCGASCPPYILDALVDKYHVVQSDNHITEKCTLSNGHQATSHKCIIHATGLDPADKAHLKMWVAQHELHKVSKPVKTVGFSDQNKIIRTSEDESGDDEDGEEEEGEEGGEDRVAGVVQKSSSTLSRLSSKSDSRTLATADPSSLVDTAMAISDPQGFWDDLSQADKASLRKVFADFVVKENILNATTAADLIRKRGGGVVIQSCRLIRSGASASEVAHLLAQQTDGTTRSHAIKGLTLLAALMLVT